ncbi:hypothetical protein [Natrinema versiforme]|uniref:Uncharacterized protein n=1 Tax=Natrinema versiforme TaxID=88724 RepID=A0A4P8WEY7_9EURY|nr:hypothetical protein [Natrinema versiforme]QCS41790.1 hypothetical protein FEJ81_05255 [Natrinema versiforme]
MPSIINEIVFSEPSGRFFGVVQLCGAFVLFSAYGYYAVVANSLPGSGALFIGVGAALSGVAESLPNNRRRAAGVLRLTAFVVLGSLFATMAFAPEFITG